MMDDRDVAIEVQGVSKNFALPHEKTSSIKSGFVNFLKRKQKTVETQHTLNTVSFEVKEGEFFGILGKNGSGKSTLLKILAEIYRPTSGSVSVKGKLVPFIELGVGFNPELTGRENVYLNGALLGFSRKQIDDKYNDIVKFAELEEFMDQKLKNYSSGMQVRLAFSVATRAEADILLVDEVLAVGDADFQRKCFDFFKDLKKLGKTVVFITHDMAAVREYCDRVILIKDGVIAGEGSADKMADEYLKLFNTSHSKDKQQDDGTESGRRWGNGDVAITSKSVKVSKDKILFSIGLKARAAVDDVVVGIRLLDDSGAVVSGVSTVNINKGAQKSLAFKPKEKATLDFELDNILSNGDFSVGVTVRSTDKITIYDSWDDALSIKVDKPEAGYYTKLSGDLRIGR